MFGVKKFMIIMMIMKYKVVDDNKIGMGKGGKRGVRGGRKRRKNMIFIINYIFFFFTNRKKNFHPINFYRC